MSTNKPEETLRDGAIKATIWRNDGDKGPFYTVELARTYEDRDGKLRDSHSFSGPDLLRVAELSRDAYRRSVELRREYNQSADQDREWDRLEARSDEPRRGDADPEDDRRESREYARERARSRPRPR